MFLLTTAALAPLVGALILTVIRGSAARVVSLLAAGVPLVIALYMAFRFQPGAGMQFVEERSWIGAINAFYALGIDGIGLSMILLTVVLTPLVLCYGFSDRYHHWGESTYLALVLVVEGLAIFVFAATDLLLFYLFFEATLIPMFFLIGGFGGPRRRYAAVKFLLYSLTSGLIMLAAIIGVYVVSQSGDATFLLSDLKHLNVSEGTAHWLFAGFMVAFIVKAPMVPLHTWLPDAASNTTAGGAVMMVAIMDKIGTFGMLRFALTMFPGAWDWATPFMIVLAVISIIYGALGALGSNDLMRFVAYTSISHFGFIVLGLFALNPTAVAGAALYMFNHGISTAALFLVIGFLVRRRGSADIRDFGGVQQVAPLLAGYLLIAGLSALSLPGLAPFVSEFGVLAGTWRDHPWATGISALAMVLAACYVMRVYKRTMTGQPGKEVRNTVTELGAERWVIVPLILMLVAFGVYPTPLTTMINPDAAHVVQEVRSNAK